MSIPLLLLPGWAHSSQCMTGLADNLGDRYEIRHVPDGAQPLATRVSRMLESVNERVILAGWSMGGMLGIEWAARNPDRTAGLVLISSTPRFCAGHDFPIGTETRNVRALSAMLRRDPSAAIEQFMRDCAAPHHPIQPSWHESSSLETIQALRDDMHYLQLSDWREQAASLKIPCLAIHGRQDRVIPWQAGEWFASHLSACRLVIFDECGHDLPVRCPERIAAEVDDYVSGILES